MLFKRIISFISAIIISSSLLAAPHHSRHTESALEKSSQTAFVSAPVNINTADEKSLQTIKGIGPKKAAAIVEYRKTNGNFKSLDDVSNVKGFGKKRLEKVKQYITV